MICQNCGSQIPDGTVFCHSCGAAQSTPAGNGTGAAPAEPAKKKSKAPIIAAVVLCVAVIGAVAALVIFMLPSRRLQAALGSGSDNTSAGYYDRAERSYMNALEIDSTCLEAYEGLVDVYIGKEDADELLDLYDDASDALSKSDFKEFEKYIIKALESRIRKAIKHKEWDLGFELADVYTEINDDPDLELLDDLDDFSPSAPVIYEPAPSSGGETTPSDTPAPAPTPDTPVDDEFGRYCDELGDIYGYGYDEGQMIVDFTFYDEDGKWHSITEFQGKVVYINFFTTWCTYCFYELPDMEDIAHDYRNEDVVVIMIDLDEGPEYGTEYAEDYDVSIPIYYVDSWEIEGMEIEAVPLSIIIDRYGMVIGNQLGQADYNWMEDTVEEAINSAW